MPNLAPKSCATLARRAPIARLPAASPAARRRINISATASSSSSSPALDPQTSVDAALMPVASPGTLDFLHSAAAPALALPD